MQKSTMGLKFDECFENTIRQQWKHRFLTYKLWESGRNYLIEDVVVPFGWLLEGDSRLLQQIWKPWRHKITKLEQADDMLKLHIYTLNRTYSALNNDYNGRR